MREPGRTLDGFQIVSGVIALVAGGILWATEFPAVFINAGHGQNGFLTAALLGGGLVLLEKRPMLPIVRVWISTTWLR